MVKDKGSNENRSSIIGQQFNVRSSKIRRTGMGQKKELETKLLEEHWLHIR